MNKILVVCVVVALCLRGISGMSEEMQELIDNLHKACVAETGAADELIDKARKGDFAEDESFKCYFKCIFDQMACMTDDGKVDTEAVIALMPPEISDKIAPVVRKCTAVGANPCDTAWLAHKCYQAGNPELYFLP